MDDATHKKWDIIFKWFGLFVVFGSGWWTVRKYDLDRTKDQNSFVFQHQATLYFDTARTAAAIATALDPKALDAKAIDAKTLTDARARFAELYWGELTTVEDRRVELATIAFQRCLLSNRVKCTREPVNQYDKPVDTRSSIPTLSLPYRTFL